ncbi:hypothetical protein G7Z17_g7333 [Cylindrodendrum hubeiense]|uniref:Transcription factor domain-containing protein n=1 Tax=Cylindrodendrum hubeiense TaxID=595255 RepID=A0A9P5H5N7_9HYPO|nr:hypothetical protein G7Z17_g7333 [Cylindrodendrum hubeiense]
MATHQSPFSASETASCSTPGYSAEARKRKRSVSGSQPAREYGLMRDTGEHDVARFVGSGSGIHYIRAVYLRLARRSATRTTQATTINNLVPGEDDQLRQTNLAKTNPEKLLWKPHEVVSDPGVGSLQPSFEDLVDWSKSFFESWHPAIPFLHGDEHHGGPTDAADGAEKLQLLTYLAKQARIRGLILELRNKSFMKRQDTADRTAFVQTELAKWSNEIQDIVEEEDEADNLSDTDTPSRPKISPGHRLMLLFLKHESTICLNRPGLASEASSPSYSSAFQACISAAKSICILFKRHRKHHRIGNDRAERRLAMPLLWPSFTWAVWISTFVLVHAAFESQVPLDSALRHVMAGKDMLIHLAARDTSWPEYCLEAVEELISAIWELSRPPPVAGDSAEVLPGSQALFRAVTSQSAPSDGQENISPSNKRRGTMSVSDPAAAVTNTDAASGRSFNESGALTQTLNVGLETNVQHQNIMPMHRGAGPLQTDMLSRQRQSRAQLFATTGVNAGAESQAVAANRSGIAGAQDPSSAFSVATDSLDPSMDAGLVEGQESMMWYDQLFASSFSAIDNPFLVAAEFDASIDPTWNYLR